MLAMPLKKQPFVIALTASTFESDRKIAEKAGMNAFISKPFKFDDLKKNTSRKSMGQE